MASVPAVAIIRTGMSLGAKLLDAIAIPVMVLHRWLCWRHMSA